MSVRGARARRGEEGGEGGGGRRVSREGGEREKRAGGVQGEPAMERALGDGANGGHSIHASNIGTRTGQRWLASASLSLK